MSKPERAPRVRAAVPPAIVRGLAVAALALLGAAVPAGAAAASVSPPDGRDVPPGTPRSRSSAHPVPRPVSTTSRSTRSTPSTCSASTTTSARPLTTTETLVAVFPDIDQNRGIRRVHPVDLRRASAAELRSCRSPTRTAGTRLRAGLRVRRLRLVPGADDRGARGPVRPRHADLRHRRTPSATSRSTSRTPNDDEFYWDVNGTGWAQPFGEVTATVELADGLAGVAGRAPTATTARTGRPRSARPPTTATARSPRGSPTSGRTRT